MARPVDQSRRPFGINGLENTKIHACPWFSITPCLPDGWQGFKVHYRYRETVYHIVVERETSEDGVPSITLDGVRRDGNVVVLVDDRQGHAVELRVPSQAHKGCE